jgi:hypothetical protein
LALSGLSDACIAQAPPAALQGLTRGSAKVIFGHGRTGLRFLAAWQNLSGLALDAALEAPHGYATQLSQAQCASLLSPDGRLTLARDALDLKAKGKVHPAKPSRTAGPGAAAVPDLWTGCYQRLTAEGHRRLERGGGGMAEAGSRAGLAMGLNALAAVGVALALVAQYARKRVQRSIS